MMPTKSVYGGWPASGEIDMAEYRGNKEIIVDSKNIGCTHVGSTLHWGTDWAHNHFWRTTFGKNTPNGKGLDEDFHKYRLKWTPG